MTRKKANELFTSHEGKVVCVTDKSSGGVRILGTFTSLGQGHLNVSPFNLPGSWGLIKLKDVETFEVFEPTVVYQARAEKS